MYILTAKMLKVSELMAQLVIPQEDVKSKIEEQGYITI